MTLISRTRRLSRSATLNLLEEIGRLPGENARSFFMSPGQEWTADPALPESVAGEIGAIMSDAPTGGALFWGNAGKFLVRPPFPIKETLRETGYAVAPLREMLSQDIRIALVLVRLGAYAIGICRGEELLASKVGTGLVHGRHKKGGSSQARFRRHREKQIEAFLIRVGNHAREILEGEARSLDYLVYGGAWTAVLELQKRSPFLQRLTVPTLPPLNDLPAPRRAVLEHAVGLVWTSRVTTWREESDGPGN
ncbi:MAG: acVLRF1 family peptidyl-tRNA hydrolase [Chloroflexota bacterium]